MIEITKDELNRLSMEKRVDPDKKKPAPPKPPEKKVTYTKELNNITKSIEKLSAKEQKDLVPILEKIVALNESQKEIMEKLTEKQEPKSWEFAVRRDREGKIEKIFARES